MDMMKCPNCGALNSKGRDACYLCLSSLRPVQNQVPQTTPIPSPSAQPQQTIQMPADDFWQDNKATHSKTVISVIAIVSALFVIFTVVGWILVTADQRAFKKDAQLVYDELFKLQSRLDVGVTCNELAKSVGETRYSVERFRDKYEDKFDGHPFFVAIVNAENAYEKSVECWDKSIKYASDNPPIDDTTALLLRDMKKDNMKEVQIYWEMASVYMGKARAELKKL